MRISFVVFAIFALLPPAWADAGGNPPTKAWMKSQAFFGGRGSGPMLRNLPDGLVVQTRTTRVEVYPGGALIERAAEVALEPGEVRLVLPALPDTMNASTLHLSGFGKDAVAGSTFLEAGTLVEARPKELVDLEEALKAIEERDRQLASEEAVLRQRRELLVGNVSRLNAAAATPVEAMGKALDYTDSECLRIDGELARLDADRKELTPQLQDVRKDYEALKARLERPVKHVVVEVSVKAKVKVPLVVRYFVEGPGWKPRHVCRFAPESGELSLETYAWVVQETGETWQDVALRVSTARPTGGLTLPEPASVEVFAEKQDSGGRVAGEARRLSEAGNPAYVPAPAGQREFAVPGTVTVESGPRGKRVLLETVKVQAEASRFAIPRTNPGVYLRLSFRNPLITSLLAGEAALFNGADYVGSAIIPVVFPGEALTLPFGRDPAIDLVRERISREMDAEGRGQQTLRYRYRFSATSRLPRPATVEVRDLLPVARDRSIRVAMAPGSPAPIPRPKDAPQGTILWWIDVPAGGTQSWEFGFSVTGPAGHRIVGAD